MAPKEEDKAEASASHVGGTVQPFLDWIGFLFSEEKTSQISNKNPVTPVDNCNFKKFAFFTGE